MENATSLLLSRGGTGTGLGLPANDRRQGPDVSSLRTRITRFSGLLPPPDTPRQSVTARHATHILRPSSLARSLPREWMNVSIPRLTDTERPFLAGGASSRSTSKSEERVGVREKRAMARCKQTIQSSWVYSISFISTSLDGARVAVGALRLATPPGDTRGVGTRGPAPRALLGQADPPCPQIPPKSHS